MRAAFRTSAAHGWFRRAGDGLGARLRAMIAADKRGARSRNAPGRNAP
jgi:hypothetical protein